MTSLTLRPMTPEDAAEAARGDKLVEETPWSQGDFLDCLNSGYTALVGEIDGQMVSWAVLRVVLDEAEVLTIGVMPEWQRQGLGEATLRALLDKMDEGGATHCFLEVRRSNTRAQKLYRKVGFFEVGLRRDYYRLGEGHEDAIVMRLEKRR